MFQLLAVLLRRGLRITMWMGIKLILINGLFWLYRVVFEIIVAWEFQKSSHRRSGTYMISYSRKGIEFKWLSVDRPISEFPEFYWEVVLWPDVIRVF